MHPTRKTYATVQLSTACFQWMVGSFRPRSSQPEDMRSRISFCFFVLVCVFETTVCSHRGVEAYPSQRGQSVTTVLSGRHLPIRKLYRAPSHDPPIFLKKKNKKPASSPLLPLTDALFIELCFYTLRGYLRWCELLLLVFAVFPMWRHVNPRFVCFRLWIPSVYFDISNL